MAQASFGAETARRVFVRKLCTAITWRDLGHIDNIDINLTETSYCNANYKKITQVHVQRGARVPAEFNAGVSLPES